MQRIEFTFQKELNHSKINKNHIIQMVQDLRLVLINKPKLLCGQLVVLDTLLHMLSLIQLF
jgi:hypothetical protein